MIKECDKTDIGRVIELGPYWAEQHGVQVFDEEQWHTIVKSMIIEYQCTWLNFVDSFGQVRGFIGGTVVAEPHEKKNIAQIQYLYLEPDFREDENLYELYKMFEAWARSLNCRAIFSPAMMTMPDYINNFFESIEYSEGPKILVKEIA